MPSSSKAHLSHRPRVRSTTVLAVRRGSHVVLAADGQVTMNNVVIKHGAQKLRRLQGGKIVAGFAGATADAFTLFERFETKLKDYSGNLTRAAVELTKDWRTDRMLRRLEALLLVADAHKTLMLSGTGDVLEPEQGAVAIGSGGNFALSSARALLQHSALDARAICEASMQLAAQLCIYTNDHIVYEEIR
ncbi:MAG: ATP-dependent protease subunit HslV [Deltaproteobacteria bacterium]|nr:MAG: ATP-dependent protease subunit HslV [Deltaproteobacteria bacterium]